MPVQSSFHNPYLPPTPCLSLPSTSSQTATLGHKDWKLMGVYSEHQTSFYNAVVWTFLSPQWRTSFDVGATKIDSLCISYIVNIALYCVSRVLYRAAHHCKYSSPIQLPLPTHCIFVWSVLLHSTDSVQILLTLLNIQTTIGSLHSQFFTTYFWPTNHQPGNLLWIFF
jgi:hypothetical protein